MIGYIGLYVFEPSLLPAFCIKNDFPNNYEKNNVIIYSFLSTMVGRYDIVIYGNGSAYYLNGIQNSDNTGARAGILPEEKINELISMFKDKGFFCLNDNYEPFISGTDMGTQRVSITIGDVTKTVEDYGGSAPNQFRDIVKELENSVKDLPSVTQSQVCGAIVTELKKVPYITGIGFC